MRYYETLLLLPIHATEEEVTILEKTFNHEAEENKGKVSCFDRWGKYRLAYPIKKHDYGMYILVRYELEHVQAFFEKIENFLRVKCNDFVLRYVHMNLSDESYNQPYHKPEPTLYQTDARGEQTSRRPMTRQEVTVDEDNDEESLEG